MRNLFVDTEVSPILLRLREILGEHSIDCYLTGGFVRDAIMRRATVDIDVVVGTRAMDVARDVASTIGGKYIPLDEPHQIARVIVPGGKHFHLDFATIRGNIEEDLTDRDFTINTIAVNLQEIAGSVITFVDPFKGWDDIKGRQVRAVSEAVLQEDPLRLMRGPRLAAELGFSIESETKTLIERNHQLITSVAAERVRDELCRLLAVPKAAESLRLLDELGLLMMIIPELSATKGAQQPKEHFWDVFEHSIEIVAAIEFVLRVESATYRDDELLAFVPWSKALAEHFEEEVSVGHTRRMLLKLAGLLHDIAKPQTTSIEENGRMRFFGHAQEGAGIVEGIMKRLMFSARETDMVSKMVEHHMRPGQMGGEVPSRRAIYRYFRDTGDVGIDTIFLNLADHLAARGPYLELDKWREHTHSLAYVLEERFKDESVVALPKLISGHDLIDIYGMAPGPQIGELLEAVREAQADGEVSTREEALSFVQKRLMAGNKG